MIDNYPNPGGMKYGWPMPWRVKIQTRGSLRRFTGRDPFCSRPDIRPLYLPESGYFFVPQIRYRHIKEVQAMMINTPASNRGLPGILHA